MAIRPAQIQFSPLFRRQLKKLSRKNPKLTKKIYHILNQFGFNAGSIQLKPHKLGGNLKNCWAISVNYHTRIVYGWKDNQTVILISLGSHDQVYR